MKKIAVVYWSGTGNTEAMAKEVANGIIGNSNEAVVLTADAFSEDMVSGFDGVAFGCPSMGCEVLEESEFQPMFDSVKSALGKKPVALFGSYGWGDGEWMRNWADECSSLGISLVADPVICNEAPDDDALAACLALGASF